MRYHWFRLRASAHPTEDVARVADALRFVSGMDAETFDDAVAATDLPSHHGGTVTLLELQATRQRTVRTAVDRLLDPSVLEELDARTDDDGTLYVRFDKQAAFQGRLQPTRGEDAVQVRLKPEVHPARRELAVAALDAWLGGGK